MMAGGKQEIEIMEEVEDCQVETLKSYGRDYLGK